MRLTFTLALAALLLTATGTHAAMGWTEATEDGVVVTRWTRGADVNEVYAAVRGTSGPNYRVLALCRQTGYFAFVGSDVQPQRGVSCGFESDAAALYAARLQCEAEGGRCDVERLGYDDGASLVGAVSRIPADLPGVTSTGGAANPVTGPVALQ